VAVALDDHGDRVCEDSTVSGWSLVGRDEELALCRRLLLDEGRSAVVVAPAGTGKTRILQQVLRDLADDAVTEMLVATRSAQGLPLAVVAALLPPDVPAPPAPIDLFRAVRSALEQRAAGRPFIVAVDDAHLVDPLSAALLHHLATTSAVQLLVAIRSGEPVEDAITALWRDGAAPRIDVQPLGLEDVATLLRSVLDGEVDGPSVRRLWRVTGGNPLYLHEVVTEALRAGTLEVVHGVWRWHGSVHIGARLRELVELRLATLDDDEQELVALLAVGDVVKFEVVERAVSPQVIARLQHRGFVVAARGEEPTHLSLDHPLFAEVVRTSMPVAERTRWCRFLAESSDLDDRDDVAVLRHAMWTIDGGVATDPDLLTRAAEVASKRWDGALADRLAGVAIEVGAGPRALLVRGDACFKLGRFGDSMSHLLAIDEALLDEEQLARFAMLFAETGFWGVGRAADTEAALDRIEQRLERRGPRERVRALRSGIMFATNDLAGASDLALPIASDPNADGIARLRSATAAAGGLSLSGHPESALELCETLLPVGFEHANESPRGLGWVVAAMVLANHCLGRFEDADRVVGTVRDAAIGDGDSEAIANATLALARLALDRGDLGRARSMAREAVAALHVYDAAGYLPWCLGIVAQIAAQLGDASAAHEAIAELDGMEWAVRVNDYDVATGRAWAAVARGEVTTPVHLLIDAAAEARATGNRFAQGLLLHEALRIGAHPRDVVEGLEESCESRGLPYHETFVAHARALAAHDGAGLEAVSDAFAAIGSLLLAAEAAAEAAVAYQRAGHTSRAERVSGVATRLLAGCGGARTPALAKLVNAPNLTRRELEVCRLAAGGLSNKAVADRLGVGVRTVEGHLLRAMTKLGVRSRVDLAAAVGGFENA
jgi:DNA-binding CsgD family transcriptional regulator